MVDFIVTGLLILAVWIAVSYMIKAKKNGTKCIGCPSGGACCSKKGGNCTCHTTELQREKE